MLDSTRLQMQAKIDVLTDLLRAHLTPVPTCELCGKPLDTAHLALTVAQHIAQNPYARRIPITTV